MMKLVIFSAVLAVAFAAFSGDPKLAQTLRFENDASPDGTFAYSYETENGIAGQESGAPKSVGTGTDPPAVAVQGTFSWAAPEGDQISIQYVADENGYQPSGSALPTPPPTVAIPAAIARALEYIAAHPQPAEPTRR